MRIPGGQEAGPSLIRSHLGHPGHPETQEESLTETWRMRLDTGDEEAERGTAVLMGRSRKASPRA